MHGDPKIVAFPGGPAAKPVVSLSEVTLERGGTPILDRVSLSLEAHGITVLIGPNGAGKSVLLRVLAGLVRPDQGRITLDASLGDPALVAQRPVLLRRSVRANLSHALRIAGLSRKQRIGRLAELLVMADLADQTETPARSLSGGEQQRLAFVRALAGSPKLLLLDEPTASLDPAATASIERLTREVTLRGMKIVFVTHDRAQAKRLCDDVVFLHRGHVSEHTPARRFFDTPASVPGRRYLAGDLLL